MVSLSLAKALERAPGLVALLRFLGLHQSGHDALGIDDLEVDQLQAFDALARHRVDLPDASVSQGPTACTLPTM